MRINLSTWKITHTFNDSYITEHFECSAHHYAHHHLSHIIYNFAFFWMWFLISQEMLTHCASQQKLYTLWMSHCFGRRVFEFYMCFCFVILLLLRDCASVIHWFRDLCDIYSSGKDWPKRAIDKNDGLRQIDIVIEFRLSKKNPNQNSTNRLAFKLFILIWKTGGKEGREFTIEQFRHIKLTTNWKFPNGWDCSSSIMWSKQRFMNAFIRSRYARFSVARSAASNDKDLLAYSILPHRRQYNWQFQRYVNTVSRRLFSDSTEVCHLLCSLFWWMFEFILKTWHDF